jgi:hypothetical protein
MAGVLNVVAKAGCREGVPPGGLLFSAGYLNEFTVTMTVNVTVTVSWQRKSGEIRLSVSMIILLTLTAILCVQGETAYYLDTIIESGDAFVSKLEMLRLLEWSPRAYKCDLLVCGYALIGYTRLFKSMSVSATLSEREHELQPRGVSVSAIILLRHRR